MNIHLLWYFRKERIIYLLVSIVIALSFSSAKHETDLHDLTVINEVRGIPIISIYLWISGSLDKGENWISTNLQPDSSVTFALPSGMCNFLAFDSLCNSYAIAGFHKKSVPDTIWIDLEYITFGRPNVDHGHHLLNLVNSLSGFALDTLILSSSVLPQDIVIDNFRIFPGSSIVIWLDKGIYSINAVDQIGRTYTADSIAVPSDSSIVKIVRSMNSNPQPPVGITGSGSGSLIIENCLPESVITELQIIPQNASNGIYLDNLALQPGASIVVNLNPSNYSLTATDEYGIEYFISFEKPSSGIQRFPVTVDYLQYDFSFPESGQE